MNIIVVPYESTELNRWNDFVSEAKNATFLLRREFMSYHQDRFVDSSLMVYNNNTLVAVLPANKEGDLVVSHGGLTYGGLLCLKEVKMREYLAYWKAVLKYLNANGIERIQLKELPKMYNRFCSDELDYMVFLTQGKCFRTDVLSVVEQNNRLPISKKRKASINKGFSLGFYVEEEQRFERFWRNVLTPNLKEKHGVSPVHSLEEIEKLHGLFPTEIRQFNLYNKEDLLIAGVTVFETDLVAHVQYISGLKNWNGMGAIDWLHHYLIEVVFKEKKYFDFGSSNEMGGRKLNGGLLFWKESFGARTMVQNFYEIETKQYKQLQRYGTDSFYGFKSSECAL